MLTVVSVFGTDPISNNHVATRFKSNKEMPGESSPLLPLHREDGESNGGSSSSITYSIRSNLPLHPVKPLPDMEIRCHVLLATRLESCSQEEALSGVKAGKNQYWIDIETISSGRELRQWLSQKLHLPTFVLDILSEPPDQWASQTLALRNALLTILRILPPQVDSDDMAHVAALQLQNLVITFGARNDVYASALQRMQERLPALQATNSSVLLTVWLRFHLDRTAAAVRHMRSAVLLMDQAMDRDVTSVEWDEIIQAKDHLLKVLSVSEEQTACVEHLGAVQPSAASHTWQTSLSTLLATAQATERMSLRLEKHVTELRQRCQGHDHEVMNRRLAVLTILSAVFLPLTLFTGIWGMNFDYMPELKDPYSYPLALLFMMTVATSMICYFYRAGWCS